MSIFTPLSIRRNNPREAPVTNYRKSVARCIVLPAAVSLSILGLLPACSVTQSMSSGDAAARGALFDELFAKTMAREAFSRPKNMALELQPESDLAAFREQFVRANSEEALFYTLVEFSNARKDRHLLVNPVEGGIQLPHWSRKIESPVRFAADYRRADEYQFFVHDIATNLRDKTDQAKINIGDELMSVNGERLKKYIGKLRPFVPYSTEAGFLWEAAEAISTKRFRVPVEFFQNDVRYGLRRNDGTEYDIVLPYLDPKSISWSSADQRSYPGFTHVLSADTFDTYLHNEEPVVLLDWHWFGPELTNDIDWLIKHAAERQLLDHNLIVDATLARGGTNGAYAVRRLSPKSFKTTFGNLRISDITQQFVDRMTSRSNSLSNTWQRDWFVTDVQKAIDERHAFSNNVPFKLHHAPKDSDGCLEPAPVHFTGKLVLLLSPHGGSHLDQFAAIVNDNELGHSIGMPTGGYSNTWEFKETITMPGTSKPIVQFMWSIGHTIRPNGEVLEGNPAPVDEYVVLTRDNFRSYHSELVDRALFYFEEHREIHTLSRASIIKCS